jgi:predicted RNA-binding protein
VCLATVYLQTGEQREEVMRDVAWVEPTQAGLRLVGLLGESKLLHAELVSVDLLHSSIVLQSASVDSTDQQDGASA